MKEIEGLSPKENFLRAVKHSLEEKEFPITWDDTKKRKVAEIRGNSRSRTAIFTAIPMECHGSKCVFANTCAFFQNDVAPLGHHCPYEVDIVVDFMADYIEQFDVPDDNLVELSMIRDLVDQEVQYYRKTKLLSQEHFIQDNIVGIDPDGDPIMQKQLHLATDMEDKLHKRRQQLFKVFLATRESRVKAGAVQLDSAQMIANLMNQVHQIQERKDKELKARMGIIDRDDYIEIDDPEKPE